MYIAELFQLLVRWTHLISAAAWVGGSIFWIFVLNPSTNKSESAFIKKMQSPISLEFRSLVDTCIFVLITTGAIMTFNRLTLEDTGYQYVLLLGTKLIFVASMFYLIRAKRHTKLAVSHSQIERSNKSILKKLTKLVTGYNLVLILGLLVYLLSDLMNMIYVETLFN